MINRSKQKGTTFERLVANYLRVQWSEFIDRRVLSGGKDLGDIVNFRIVGRHRLVIECKDHRKMELSEWVKEAQEEADNDNAVAGIVVHKRVRFGMPDDQYVTCTLGDFLAILRAASGK